MTYSSFGGFAFSNARRAHARPNASTLAQTAGGRYMARRSSFSSSGFVGRPRFFGSSMVVILVPQIIIATVDLWCHNKCTDQPERTMNEAQAIDRVIAAKRACNPFRQTSFIGEQKKARDPEAERAAQKAWEARMIAMAAGARE